MNRIKNDDFAAKAERALQEAVADVVEEHRRSGKPIVVARGGKPVRVDPNTVRTVREEPVKYGTGKTPGQPADD